MTEEQPLRVKGNQRDFIVLIQRSDIDREKVVMNKR